VVGREGRCDEDLFMEYDDSASLRWKEILSLTDDYDKGEFFHSGKEYFDISKLYTA
jgi:hypothetical protein